MKIVLCQIKLIHTQKGEFYSLMQSNDPLVLLHKSSVIQLCVPIVHSSTSENEVNNEHAVKILVHLILSKLNLLKSLLR